MLAHVMAGCDGGAADRGRAAVYAAEDQWSRLLDRGGAVDFFGSSLTLTPQRSFEDLGEVQRYVADICMQLNAQGWQVTTPRVRARRGRSAAHYDRAECVIAVPTDTHWAMRESVLLHEFAHHLRPSADPIHGPQFREAMLEIVRITLGDEATLLLDAAYHGVGLQ